MRAVVWINESRWEDCVDAVPAEADVTLMHVAPGDVEALMRGPRLGLQTVPAILLTATASLWLALQVI